MQTQTNESLKIKSKFWIQFLFFYSDNYYCNKVYNLTCIFVWECNYYSIHSRSGGIRQQRNDCSAKPSGLRVCDFRPQRNSLDCARFASCSPQWSNRRADYVIGLMYARVVPDLQREVHRAGICAESASIELWACDCPCYQFSFAQRKLISTLLCRECRAAFSTLGVFSSRISSAAVKNYIFSPWPDNDPQPGRGWSISSSIRSKAKCEQQHIAAVFCRHRESYGLLVCFGRNEHLAHTPVML